MKRINSIYHRFKRLRLPFQALIVVILAIFVGSTVYAGLGGFTSPPPPSINLSQSLAGHWKFDGNANDSSGNGMNGLANGATPTTDRFGNTSGAYDFDGVDDWVSMSGGANLNVGGSMTLSFWFKAPYAGTTQYFFDNRTPGSWWLIKRYTGCTANRICLESRVTAPDASWTPDAWNHIVVTDSASESKIYMNGQLAGTGAGDGAVSVTTNLRAGTRYSGTGFFQGQMDEVRLYSRVINDAEVEALYQGVSNEGSGRVQVSNTQKRLVGWWKFDGDAEDSSAYYQHGTVTGATLAADRKNRASSAYSFSGNDSDRIVMPDSSQLSITKSVTISTWVYASAPPPPGEYAVLVKKRDNSEDSYQLLMQSDGAAYFNIDTGSPVVITSSAGSLTDSEWHHVAGVWNQGTGQMSLYIDGVLVQTGTINGTMADTTTDLRIGGFGTSGVFQSLQGKLDDVRIYDWPLTLTDIKQISDSYNAEISISSLQKGLAAHWAFNGDGKDSTPNYNHGTINGAILTTDRRNRGSSAYSFDGITDEITTNSTFGMGNTDLSISLWVYIPSLPNKGAFIKIGSSITALNNGFGLGIGGATYEATGSNFLLLFESKRWIPTGVTFTPGWHHVVMTIDGSGVPDAYLDGQFINTYAGSTASAPTTITTLGGYTASNGANRHFSGSVDDVRVYKRELNSAEVQRLYETYQ